MKSLKRCLWFCSVSLAAAGTSLPAAAQQATNTEPGARLEEIIVTAQKREQKLQDVPIAVSAFKAETLENKGITRLDDLDQADPSLVFNSNGGAQRPMIRGIASGGIVPGNEGSASVYIDEVYYAHFIGIFMDINNIDRVEVLKGPQGTLFGRNSVAGLIHVITRDPDLKNTIVDATVGYANYETLTAKLYASTPINDRIAVDFALSEYSQQNGWGRNVCQLCPAFGSDIYQDQHTNYRSKLVAIPTDTTKITAIAYYANEVDSTRTLSGQFPGVQGYIVTPAINGPPQVIGHMGGFYDTDLFSRPNSLQQGGGGSLKLDQQIAAVDLVSISAYRNTPASSSGVGGFGPYPTSQVAIRTIDQQFSEELQLKSRSGSSFDWVIGSYYLYTRAGANYLLGGGSLAPNSLDLIGIQKDNSRSAFGQATFHVLERTDLTAGMRYTTDNLSGAGTETFITGTGAQVPAAPAFNGTKDFSKGTYKIALDHKFTPDVMAYASYSTGYKAAAFNTIPLNRFPLNPETTKNYEVGLKSTLFDGRMIFDLAVFSVETSDLQVSALTTVNGVPVTRNENAAAARNRGFEVSTNMLVTEGLTANLAMTYYDSKFLDYRNAVVDLKSPVYPYAVTSTPLDLSGTRYGGPDGGPELRATAGLTYDFQSSLGQFSLNANAAYTGSYPVSVSALNDTTISAYTLVNASVTYKRHADSRWMVRLWGKNLTNTHYYAGFDAPLGYAPGAPLAYGVEFNVKN
jgi:iron complex outermembrane receptor protein